MAVNRKFLADAQPARREAIQYLTENGFRIIRLSDIDSSYSIDGPEHCFLVRDPHDYELEITVDITPEAVAEIVNRSRGRISLASSYWISCAERHLAEYLWQQDDYPPDGKLIVDQLTLDDINLVWRWNRDQEKER